MMGDIMNMRIILMLTLMLGFSGAVSAVTFLDVEGGRVWTGYNDVRIPAETGTDLSLRDDVEPDPAWYYRARVGYFFAGRHYVSILAAPLTVRGSGTAEENVNFDGTVFPAGTELESTFRFNTYRPGYRYDFYRGPLITAGAGLTVLIRDAYIEIEGGGQRARSSNVGFAPLVNFRVLAMPVRYAGFLLEGDALASPQGRAFDVLGAVVVPLGDTITARAGYRVLEGGSDGGDVYTFSMFHFAVFGVEVRL